MCISYSDGVLKEAFFGEIVLKATQMSDSLHSANKIETVDFSHTILQHKFPHIKNQGNQPARNPEAFLEKRGHSLSD